MKNQVFRGAQYDKEKSLLFWSFLIIEDLKKSAFAARLPDPALRPTRRRAVSREPGFCDRFNLRTTEDNLSKTQQACP
jgi:hypothetical protein